MQTEIKNTGAAEKQAVLLFTIWGLAVCWLGSTGALKNGPAPLLGTSVILLCALLVLLYFKVCRFKDLGDSIPLKYLTLFHSWRIFAGWLFLAWQDSLPSLFVHEAAYGDIAVGFLAILVFIFAQKRTAYYIFNIIGLTDLVLAMSISTSFVLKGGGAMAPVLGLPLIMIPLLGVPVAVFAHILAFTRLRKNIN